MTTVYCVAGTKECPPELIPSHSAYNIPFRDNNIKRVIRE